MRGGRALAMGALALGAGCAGGNGGDGHDAVPASHDVVVRDAPPGGEQGYEYVARRPLAVVALAEARGVDLVVARAAIDRLADALDTCATDEGRKGTLVNGAARVIAQLDDDGRVAATTLRLDPGAGVAQNAVVCLVAPMKMLTFPAADAGARGIAIEALWGRVISK